jgi:asparagine synthase (glutamine-hydrolysing)
LSGGLDSSLIAGLVQRNLCELNQPPLKTFSIGFEGSSDVKHARMVAEWIGSKHTEIIMTPDEFFDAIPTVIKAIESYDTTTVRASVGNYLIAKKIRELTDCKVVFNGDGSDEVFGGYLYFNNAPDDVSFHAETERLLSDIHTFDVLRSDRSISANGLEARTPFLDKQFVSVVRSIDPSFLRPIKASQVEKNILRMAFDDGLTLPKEVLWRRKEAFSDGVSKTSRSLYQIIEEYIDTLPDVNVSTQGVDALTKEQKYYKSIFEKHYPNALNIVQYYWMPKYVNATDASARTLDLYNNLAGTEKKALAQ